jgi:hypothetical protein
MKLFRICPRDLPLENKEAGMLKDLKLTFFGAIHP